MWFILLFLVISTIVLLWQISLIWAQIFHVPVVFTNNKTIEQIFELADFKPSSTFIDLGCGDARLLIKAATKYKIRCIGIDNSIYSYLRARINVFRHKKTRDIKIVFGDFTKLTAELHKADIVYVYLLNSVNKKIEDWLFKSIGEHTKIISLSFQFFKHQPKETTETVSLGIKTKIYLYKKN